MTRSIRLSQITLRIGLAIVFFWLGVSTFIHPTLFVTSKFVYLVGVFEILVGLSFVTGVFMPIFALLGAIFFTIHGIVSGLTDITVRDIGLVGGLLAILLWPERI